MMSAHAAVANGAQEYAQAMPEAMPFEQAILDVALAEVVQQLSAGTESLDAKRQIVDGLTASVDRETLVAVRMLKNKQQELLDRVTVVLDQLEHTAGAFARAQHAPHACSGLAPRSSPRRGCHMHALHACRARGRARARVPSALRALAAC